MRGGGARRPRLGQSPQSARVGLWCIRRRPGRPGTPGPQRDRYWPDAGSAVGRGPIAASAQAGRCRCWPGHHRRRHLCDRAALDPLPAGAPRTAGAPIRSPATATLSCPKVARSSSSTKAATNRAGWSGGTSSSRLGGNNQVCRRLNARGGIPIHLEVAGPSLAPATLQRRPYSFLLGEKRIAS